MASPSVSNTASVSSHLRKFLELLNQSSVAYTAETAGSFQEAYQLHQSAISELERLGESLSFLSSHQRDVKRAVTRKIELHAERVKALKSYLDGGKKDASFTPPPTALTAIQESLQENLDPGKIANLSYVERNAPQVFNPSLRNFTSTLDSTLSAETYHIHLGTKLKETFRGWSIFTVSDASDQHLLYLLEINAPPKQQISSANFSRSAEYNIPCITIYPTPVKPSSASGFKGRVMTLAVKSLPGPFVETPDRVERTPWGPRRFTYGGRRFVWKAAGKSDDLRPETLYEYTKTWAKADSKTGKKEDDAFPTALFWEGKTVSRGWVVHCVRGLDEVFKECLFATQLTKLACMLRGLR